MSNHTTFLGTYLARFTETDWLNAIEELLPSIHEVDRNAVQIWFRFYPLSLKLAIDAAENREEVIRGFALQGNFELKDQIDTSHHFLYGHRYWKTVKAAIEAEAAVFTDQTPELADEIRDIARLVAEKLSVEPQMIIAMVAIGLATLNQSGLEAFKAASGDVKQPTGMMAKSPNAVIAERSMDDSQGLLGFLKTVNKRFSVNYASLSSSGKFPIMLDQEITGASGADHSQDWQKQDSRCWEGPVPIECTAASCGTCWVGVLGGERNLSEVEDREWRKMKEFGYLDTDDPLPVVRLACRTRVLGSCSIVVPPWNGVFGKLVEGKLDPKEEEGATASA